MFWCLFIYMFTLKLTLFFQHIPAAVERGLEEIRKLGIETQLWDESRKELEQDIDNSKVLSRSDF